MGNITLKDYFQKLDNYQEIINNEIRNILKNTFTNFDDVNIIQGTFVDDNNLLLSLKLIDSNNSRKKRVLEVSKVNGNNNQIVFNNVSGACVIYFENEKISNDVMEQLFSVVIKYQNYFLNKISKQNILASIGKSITDKVLEQVVLDENKLPKFDNSYKMGKK